MIRSFELLWNSILPARYLFLLLLGRAIWPHIGMETIYAIGRRRNDQKKYINTSRYCLASHLLTYSLLWWKNKKLLVFL